MAKKSSGKLDKNSQEIARNEKGQLLPGVVLNPQGRPLGSPNFATKFYAFIEKVAKRDKLEPDEVEEQLLKVGFLKAKKGEYNFWRDLHDRVYGKARETHEVIGKDGGPLEIRWKD